MRILIHSAPPYAQSGYGTQCKFMALALKELGHEVAVSCYAGVHEEREWNGIQLLSTGGKMYGNRVIAGNYRRWDADCLITLMDLFTLETPQFRDLVVFPWVPVDVKPLGPLNRQWLEAVGKIADLHPIAMSEHAREMMAEANIQSVVVPMATNYRPSELARATWRHTHNIPPDAFLIAKVGVNDEDNRKTFTVTELAFAELLRRNRNDSLNLGLYLHCEPQVKGSPNLVVMAQDLGLTAKNVMFCDPYMRACDLYGDDYMHGLYCAADVLDATSKGEGFGVPIIEALACGTPVIGSRNSAVTEKLDNRARGAVGSIGWLVDGQREWAIHHHSWWSTPDVRQLVKAYESAFIRAKGMRGNAAAAGARWSPAAMRDALATALVGPGQ